MANDCLVTKLKGVVDNPNLPKLGYIKIHINNQQTDDIFSFWCSSNSNIEVNIIGNGYLYKGDFNNRTNQTTTISGVNNTVGYRLSEGEYDVEIYSKYALDILYLGQPGGKCGMSINFDDLKYSQFSRLALQSLLDYYGNITGKLSSIQNINSFNFYALGTRLEFTMREYAQINMSLISYSLSENAMLELGYFSRDTSKVSGAIEDLITYAPTSNYNENIGADYRVPAKFMRSTITFNGGHIDNTLRAKLGANGNGQIVKEVDGTVLATYNKSTNTWIYN